MKEDWENFLTVAVPENNPVQRILLLSLVKSFFDLALYHDVIQGRIQRMYIELIDKPSKASTSSKPDPMLL